MINKFWGFRDSDGTCHFLQVDVILEQATFYTIFTDAQSMPPPYRIDNLSEVQIQYFQTKTNNDKLRTIIKPNSKGM